MCGFEGEGQYQWTVGVDQLKERALLQRCARTPKAADGIAGEDLLVLCLSALVLRPVFSTRVEGMIHWAGGYWCCGQSVCLSRLCCL